MSLPDALRYRLIKIYANASKVLLSLHLRLFPAGRRTIPAFEPARRAAANEKRIPRKIWQTNYTNRVTPQVYACFRFNRFVSPTYEYHFWGDDECDAFVEENFPGEVWDAYRRLQVGAAKADFWRILVLLKHGGLYLDIDSNLTGSPEVFIPADADDMFIAMKNGEVTNYFLACAPGHPVLQEVCRRIVDNIREGSLKSVYDMTGPTVLDAVVKEMGVKPYSYKQACTQGQFINKTGQYADKANGAWWIEQKEKSIVRS